MYSIRENSRGGHFRSHLTGKVYEYTKDPAGVNKRKAVEQLKADDAKIRDAANTRAMQTIGRNLSESEIRSGAWLPDTRTTQEKIEQDAVHHCSTPGDPTRNVQRERVAELQAELAAARPADRANIEKRIRLAEKSAAEFDRKLAEKRAWEERMSAPGVADAIVDGRAWLARLQTNPNVPQEWVNAAQKRLSDLELTGNTDGYWKETLAFEAVREQVLTDRAKALDQQAAEIKSQASEVRRERSADHPADPAPSPAAEPNE